MVETLLCSLKWTQSQVTISMAVATVIVTVLLYIFYALTR